jgi:hypothetical protein
MENGKNKISRKRNVVIVTILIMFSAIILSILITNPQIVRASFYMLYLPIIQNQGPTPTPTKTPIPTPTATQIPPGVYVLPNHSHYETIIDYLHIVGEVWNNTNDNLTFLKISANFFNSSNQLVDTDFTYTYLDTLPAGDKTCFSISLPEPSNWDYYEFEYPSFHTDGSPLPNLTILNDSGSINDTFGWYEIIGQVRNDHGSRVEFVSPVGTLYDSSGTVMDCGFTYVNNTDLEAGQISSFKMTFSGMNNYLNVTLYRLQIDGNP